MTLISTSTGAPRIMIDNLWGFNRALRFPLFLSAHFVDAIAQKTKGQREGVKRCTRTVFCSEREGRDGQEKERLWRGLRVGNDPV